MKIRFMCLRHYCDLNIEFDEEQIRKLQGKEQYLVQAPTLVANADGTYDFDLSNMYCPEFSSLVTNMSGEQGTAHQDFDKFCDDNVCSGTWTVVMYNNFTAIGEPA